MARSNLNPVRDLRPCTTCGKNTELRCADCAIDTGVAQPVCSSTVCRDKHEAVFKCNPTLSPAT